MSDEPAGIPPPDVDARLGRLESAVDTIKNLLTRTHGEAQQVTEARLDAPGSVAEEVQRELERRDAQVKQDERDALLGRHDEAIKGLTEKAPVPPPRRIERLMGWHQ